MSQQQPQTGGMQGTGQYQQVKTGDRAGLRFHTRNFLNDDVRRATCQRLNRTLADTSALRMGAKYAHWNVKGMEFYQLHELFEEIAETFAEQEDAIAERIAALGGQAQGTLHRSATRTRIREIPPDTNTGRGFVQELATRLAIHDANLYDDVCATEASGDLDSMDLLNEISREVSQYLWFLEAHLQGPPEGQVWGAGQGRWLRGNSQ